MEKYNLYDSKKKQYIFFDDGEKISKREGFITDYNDKFIIIDNREMIPISRIIRTEVIE